MLVVHGEPGTGKTALLDFAAGLGSGLQVVRAAGAEPEAELAFGGLHRLCGSMLDLLGRLPGPQREALEIAFGMRAGTGPDRFLVGLAVLRLLAESAAAVRSSALSTRRTGWTRRHGMLSGSRRGG